MHDLLTTTEVAKVLGVSPGRVRQFVMLGRLKPARKYARLSLFDRRAVEKFAKIPRKTGNPGNSATS